MSKVVTGIGEAIGVVKPKVPKDVKRAKAEAKKLRDEQEKLRKSQEERERARRRARLGGNFGRRLLTFADDGGDGDTLGV